MLHISLAAEKIGQLWGFPISNALLTTWLVMAVLVILSLSITRALTLVPSRSQSIAELLVGGLYGFFETVVGTRIKQFFPLVASIFIYILFANWIGLLPGVGTVGFFHTSEKAELVAVDPATADTVLLDDHGEPVKEVAADGHGATESQEEPAFTPLLRGATADLNTTIALAIVAVVAIQYYGFKNLGRHYTSRFINVTNPINFFVGMLELISELSKIISFAFRLFGNIFAGEVLLAVIAFLMPFFVPLPFLLMELFVGFIQALVFSMLTAVFLNVAVSHGEHEAHGEGVSAHG